MSGMIVNCELLSMSKDADAAYFNVLSKHLLGVSLRNHEKPKDSWSPGRVSKQGLPEHKTGLLITQTRG